MGQTHDLLLQWRVRLDARTPDLVTKVLAVFHQPFPEPFGSGDGLRVDAKIAQDLAGIAKTAAGQRHVHHQFAVPGRLALQIEAWRFAKSFAPEERALLKYIAG